MKLTKSKKIAGFLFYVLMGCFNINAQEPQIQIYMGEFPPYTYMENKKPAGFATDVIKRIMKDLNVNYKISSFPHSRLHLMFKEDSNIMAYVLFRTPERENLYKWIGPIMTDHVHIYKKKGSQLIINNIEDAKNKGKISTFSEGVTLNRLKKMGFTNLETTAKVDGTILKVLHDRVELMIGLPDLSLIHWLKQNGYSQDALEKIPIRIATFDMYIVCSKDLSDSIIEKWQKKLDALKSSGEFSRLYQKYRN